MSYRLELYIARSAAFICALSAIIGMLFGQSYDFVAWKLIAAVGFGYGSFAWRNCIEMLEANR